MTTAVQPLPFSPAYPRQDQGRWETPRAWIERNLWIRDKAGAEVPFRLNGVQRRLDATLEDLRHRGKLPRLIILKARQEGVSTWMEGRVYEAVRRNPGLAALIIGNEMENSDHLYEMFRLFYHRDPSPLDLERSNRKELRFARPHASHVLVSTAEKAHAGTGHTNQVLHISELSKWPRAQETMLSLLQTLPRLPNTLGVIESTAFGASGYFYDLWHDAEKGLNEWTPVFLAWFDLPEYQMPVGAYPLDRLGQEPRYNVYPNQETMLRDTLGVTVEQLTWRRWAIDNLCGGDAELFMQEYPATALEAFLVSGRPRFAQYVLQRWLHAAVKPLFTGTLDASGHEIAGEGDFVRIWHRPEPGHLYSVGADCSEGLEGGDFQAAAVYDQTARRQVATIHGTMEADDYAELIARVAQRYGTAQVAVEVNGCGWAVLNRLRRLYHHLYHRQEYDRETRKPGVRIGWHTNSITKPDLVGKLAEAIRDDAVGVEDRDTIEELMAYAYVGGGTSAPEGHYDDRVMALGIAVTVAGETTLGEYRHYDKARNETVGTNDEEA